MKNVTPSTWPRAHLHTKKNTPFHLASHTHPLKYYPRLSFRAFSVQSVAFSQLVPSLLPHPTIKHLIHPLQTKKNSFYVSSSTSSLHLPISQAILHHHFSSSFPNITNQNKSSVPHRSTTAYNNLNIPRSSSIMDGLLRSEFALVLRDSLNSTPRRHVISPQPPPIPSSPKKPRSSDFAIRCDMKLEPRLQFAPFPTSPTSPLPSSKLLDSPAPLTSTTSTPPPPLPSPPILPVLRHDLPNSPRRHSVPSTKRHLSFTNKLEPLHCPTPPASPPTSSISTRPLDVLASVSAEQKPQLEIPKTSSSRLNSISHIAPSKLQSLPTSPVNSESINPLFSDEKRKPRSRITKPGKPSGRVFSCTQCTSTFSQQFNLNKHIRAVHERRRPFQCDVCHARFQQKSHRTMHHLAVHEKLRQFACDQCSASFSWRGVLKKHRKSIHGLDD